MAKVRRKRPGVAIDTVPLPEKVIGMATKKGRVSAAHGRFYITVGRRKLEIPVGPIVSRSEVRQMVGKSVYVALSGKRKTEIVAIGTWPTPEKPTIRRRWILCYIPGPDMIGRIDLDVRKALLRKMIAEDIITSKLARQIRRGSK